MYPLIPFISTIHKIVVLYNYTVPYIKIVYKMCKHLQNELLDSYFKFDRPLLALCLHFSRKPMGIAVNKINRGESVCTKKNNSSKRLVIVVIINQNKVHLSYNYYHVILMFTIPSIGGWSQIKNHNSKSKIVLEFGRRIPMSILLDTQILSYLMSHFNIFTE